MLLEKGLKALPAKGVKFYIICERAGNKNIENAPQLILSRTQQCQLSLQTFMISSVFSCRKQLAMSFVLKIQSFFIRINEF